MALVATELLQSQTVENVEGRKVGKRVFSVADPVLPSAYITPLQALTASGIPAVGATFPGDSALIYFGNYRTFRFEGNATIINVELEYRNIGIIIDPQDPGESGIGHVETHVSFDAVSEDVYRRPINPGETWPEALSAPALGQVSGAQLATDIGGVPMDVHGEPTSVVKFTAVVEIVEVVGVTPFFGTFQAAAGKRNLTTWLGAPPGFILYQPPQSSKIDSAKWRITHRFHYDEFMHLKQLAELDGDRNVVCKRLQLPGQETSVAAKVFWRQPFPQLFDFNLLSVHF